MAQEENSQQEIARLRSVVSERGESWVPKATSMSVLSAETFKIRLGVPPPPGRTFRDLQMQSDSKRASLLAEIRSAAAPAAYDLRNVGGKNFITDIRDQGSCGSCVAFGVSAAMEGTLRVQENKADLPVNISEAHLFYCHGRSKGRNCSNGWIPDEALAMCQSIGVVDEGCYPYAPGDQNCTGRCSDWQQRLYKVTGFHLVNSPAEIKTWVSTKGPLTACFIVYDDFRYYSSGVYRHVSGAELGGHCVSIIGYNDAQNCWICKNSWGAGWGENGFFKIGYGECAIDTWQVCAVEGVKAPDSSDDDEKEKHWEKNRLLTALWGNDQPRNAWVHAEGVGWRKISPRNDGVFLNLLAQSAAAKAARRPVNFLDEGGVIAELYVL